MSSEIIVVLVLIALAIGFIIWVRKNSRDHDRAEQAGAPSEETRATLDTK
jgi:flagellar basal body-associated protein FliL